VHEINPAQALIEFRTSDEIRRRSLLAYRLRTVLLASLAGLALALSIVGVYGMVAYNVASRRGELGVRLALGASSASLIRLVMQSSMKPVAIGVALGIPLALGVGRLLSSLLFGVSGTDAVTFVLALCALLIPALAACYLPARRTMGLDPALMLRR